MEKINGSVARFLDSEQGQRSCGVTLHLSQIIEECEFGPLVVTL